MRILLTGAGGVVGTAVEATLRRSGKETIAVKGRETLDFESFEQTKALFRFVKPTHVVHLAAAVYGVGGNLAFPADAIRRNLLINTHVVAATAECGATKIVAMGTTAIYSDKAEQPFREDDALLGTPHASELPYAYAKRAMLVQLEAYQRQFGLAFAYAIATNMYGPHDRFDPEYGHVAPSLISKFATAADRAGAEVAVWGDGTPTRDFLYSEDAAEAIALILAHGQGAYNLATGVSTPIMALVNEISLCFPQVKYSWDPSKPKGQLSRAYDVSRIRGLGFSPRHNLASGVRKTVEWYLANKDSLRRT